MGVTDKIDYSKVDPGVLAKIKEWEKNKPEVKQVAALQDLSDHLEQLIITMEQGQTADEDSTKQLGAILVDIRNSLTELNKKETPEAPETDLSPVVEAVTKLEQALTKALAAVEVKPEFTPTIHVDAPQVNVSPPGVDLKGVEQAVAGLSSSFKAAIASIPESPETDISPLTALLGEMSAKLSDIDTASRMKPQAPTRLQVTNPDGSLTGQAFIDFQWDFVTLTQTTLTDVYSFYLGDQSALGKRMKTVTITYTDSGKLTIATVGKTA